MPPQAVVFAAGHAERLLPLTASRPKAMLLLGGKPLVQHAVEALAAHGVEHVVLVVGRHGEKIQSFLKDGRDFGVSVSYVTQDEPIGTTDALQRAREHLQPGPVWAVSGAVFVTPAILKPLGKGDSDAVVVAPAGDGHSQPVPVLRGGQLADVRWEAPAVGSTRVMTGILRLRQETIEALADAKEAELEDALGARAATRRVDVLETEGPWHRLIEPWDVLRLHEHVLDRLPAPEKKPRGRRITGTVHVPPNARIASTAVLVGPVWIGEGCTIGHHTVIGPYVSLRSNTVVGAHCEVRHSILNNNVVVDSRSLVRGSILDDGAQAGPGLLVHETDTPRGPVGCIVGRDSRIGAGVRVEGGALVGPETTVDHGTVVR